MDVLFTALFLVALLLLGYYFMEHGDNDEWRGY